VAFADAPTPLPGRATDADRRRIARLLHERSTDGRLSRETYAARVEQALTARTHAELDDLVADVRRVGPLRRAALGAVAWAGRLAADVEAAWTGARLPVLALPVQPGRSVTVGRSPNCDCVVADASVSRRHLQLSRTDERWLLRDLGSRNGTRVNGVRVTEDAEVRPGDQVSLGDVRYRLGRRAG
jgi:FHA domain/Domain of unknown function (DUF1707)